MLLVVALWSCGGSSTAARHDAAAGSSASGSDSGSAGSGSGSSSAGKSSAAAGKGNSSAGVGGAAAGGPANGGAGGVTEGGAGGDNSSAGAAGAEHCLDACGLYGAACCAPAIGCVEADASCTIDVYEQAIGTTSDYAAIEKAVDALPPSFLLSFTTADITWAGAEAPAAARIELRLSAAVSAEHGKALLGAFNHPFRLSCAQKRVFVGLIYMPQGAAAIPAPVFHVSRDAQDGIILRLGASQTAWLFPDSAVDIASRNRLDRPELRAALCAAGVLHEL